MVKKDLFALKNCDLTAGTSKDEARHYHRLGFLHQLVQVGEGFGNFGVGRFSALLDRLLDAADAGSDLRPSRRRWLKFVDSVKSTPNRDGKPATPFVREMKMVLYVRVCIDYSFQINENKFPKFQPQLVAEIG